MMRVLVNDHSGHAFPIQLSKELARNGYRITHTYSANFQSPKGNFEIEEDLKAALKVVPIFYEKEFNKYSIIYRRKQELEFASKLIKEIKKFKPRLLINCNTPLFAQQEIQQYCLRQKIKFVFWCQDLYSIAITKILQSKFGILGRVVGSYFKKLERNQLQKSSHIIAITSDFNQMFSRWQIEESKITIIPNWAPVNEIPIVPKSNPWSVGKSLDKYFCFVYSGTLGLKHNPALLLQLAMHFKKFTDVKVVVISEGIGADFLKRQIDEQQITNLDVLAFQKFSDMPEILGCADVLVAILEPDAGVYSVPSKMLSYMCARKPILLSVPLDNLSSRIIMNNDAGLCADPKNMQEFIHSAERLYYDKNLRMHQANNAREYAEEHFNIEKICSKFTYIIRTLFPEEHLTVKTI